MDYENDIGKYVYITILLGSDRNVVKGKLEKVDVINGVKRLLIINAADKTKRNIITEDAIKTYFARPWSEV